MGRTERKVILVVHPNCFCFLLYLADATFLFFFLFEKRIPGRRFVIIQLENWSVILAGIGEGNTSWLRAYFRWLERLIQGTPGLCVYVWLVWYLASRKLHLFSLFLTTDDRLVSSLADVATASPHIRPHSYFTLSADTESPCHRIFVGILSVYAPVFVPSISFFFPGCILKLDKLAGRF